MSRSEKIEADLLVLDLDNTLWDWFHPWYLSFTALLEGVVSVTGLDRSKLEREIRVIHQKRGTSEYSQLLEELGSVRDFLNGRDTREVFDAALHAQNSARIHATRLYPDVKETLEVVKSRGTRIVAYTEAVSFYTMRRIKTLKLDGIIDVLYSAPDHDFPAGVSPADVRTRPDYEYRLESTQHHHTPHGHVKPDEDILRRIIGEQNVDSLRVVYVGDSLSKDILMAQSVGAQDVWAKYGEIDKTSPEYEQLIRVSHWPDKAISQEVGNDNPAPNFVLERGLSQLFDHFTFGATSR